VAWAVVAVATLAKIEERTANMHVVQQASTMRYVTLFHTPGNYAGDEFSFKAPVIKYCGQQSQKRDKYLDTSKHIIHFFHRDAENTPYTYFGIVTSVEATAERSDNAIVYDLRIAWVHKPILCDRTVQQYTGRGCRKYQKSAWDHLGMNHIKGGGQGIYLHK
jgi:hypothetical protein